jgi:dipeptidyl-peptidase-4
MSDETVESFPRQSARTQRYTLGEPRDVVVSPDGQRIVFLRSRGPTDPVNCLWVVDAESGEERLIADPEVLLRGRDEGDLPPEELARRERTREAASGITAFATDAAVTVASFAIAGRLFVAGLISAQARELPVAGPVFDPRPDPIAQRVAYVSGRLLCIGELDGHWRVLAGGDPDEPESITWGSADFVAAEEMHRFRGFWWSPDGGSLAVARVDTTPVQRWHIGDPAQPDRPPTEVAYPAAGTPNADVTLHVIDLDGNVVDVEWDRGQFPYLVDVQWTGQGLLITTQRRDQRMVEVLEVSPTTGATELRWADMDDQWVELVPGVPRLAPDGTLVTCADRDGARRLLVDGEPVTPPELQVRAVESVDAPGIVFVANPVDDSTVLHVWRRTTSGELEALTDEPGVHAVAAGGGRVVVRTTTLAEPGAQWETLDGVELASHAATPVARADVHLSFLGERRIATAVLLPADHDGSRLPVLLDPYGGPHGGRVVQAHNAHVGSQWFADQGFAVVVADGRGTPGRGSAWERAVHLDLATAVLDDQVEALERAAEEHGVLDLERVGIRGWSFGGYLAALAVLRRPDVFHAAIAGAPVTEWRLYDTHYTERYLGDPVEQPDAYDASSLLALAADLTRPLLLIHGLADDNVVAAHTLRLSAALLEAGRPHEVLPLVGVTHMTSQEVVAENLLLHQLEFLRRTLGLDTVAA